MAMTGMRITTLAVAMGMTVLAAAAWAEVETRYAPVYFDTDYPGVLAIKGKIDRNTALKFQEAVSDFGKPQVLSLSSPGGIVSEALLIARSVHDMGVNTHIQSGEQCLSACSLIFFGGVVRNAQGDLGVHQLSSSSGDAGQIQDSASYIVAALADFDVPSDLLVSMLRTPSDQMYIVPLKEKIEYGLMQTAAPARPPEPVPDHAVSPERKAVAFVSEHYQAWSMPNGSALPRVTGMYAEWVDFYGAQRSYDEIYAEKAEFATRWPERHYALMGDTVSASCAPPNCYVSGQYRWDVRVPSSGERRGGTATINMTLREVAGGFRIVAEDGRVVSRN